jgi:hypothetical protein
MLTRVGIAETQDALENRRYLEYGAILNARNPGAIGIEAARHRGDAGGNVAERIQYDSRVMFLHPVGVVAFLQHGPRIAHQDDGQPLLNGFTDAAGTRLADEEIAQLHEIADLR